ncbi:DUF1073 domain [Commensalibacter communis]|uniref:DUF1073 domain n=1 Tax=Commensalibacter communis TaxID=2972786 RepID=A0A9W4X7S5_9PROT|nr:anti-CBASS Acb1 family protein [Commensalibacter communis]CAI3957934.1 DUF1073 domain [Commensalibacter communis]CAI3960217.1 DUF1073 domain [Commensalibacter communis]
MSESNANSYCGSFRACGTLQDKIGNQCEKNGQYDAKNLSYELCKILYVYHPLGKRLIEIPVNLSLNKKRIIKLQNDYSAELIDQFEKKWQELKITQNIKRLAITSRLYGIGALFLKIKGIKDTELLDKNQKLENYEIHPVVYDAMNIAGTASNNHNIDSIDFLQLSEIVRGGEALAKDRSCILSNGDPIYIEYIESAYGYGGRSIFQNCFDLMYSYLSIIHADNAVAKKVATLIIKLNQVGSANRVQEGASAQKRQMLATAGNGDVVSMAVGEEAETLSMMNVDQALDTARRHIIEDIANAVDLPVILLNGQKFSGGFGEGTEDAKNIAQHVDAIREWLEPVFNFCDDFVMDLAWNFDFIDALNNENSQFYDKTLLPEEKQKKYNIFIQELKATFSYEFPSFLTETQSQIIESDNKKLMSIMEVFKNTYPLVDVDTKVKLICWVLDSVNELKGISDIKIDYDPEKIMGNINENGLNNLNDLIDSQLSN